MKKFNIYVKGKEWLETDDILIAVNYCKTLLAIGFKRDEITIWNSDGVMTSLQF